MLKIYNTLTRQKEKFKPLQPGKVGMYVCGVTVYDYCHIGHARTYVSADVVLRYLRFRGYEVNYVRNITDIDDKIIKRANETKEDVNTVTKRFIQAMHEDFAALGLAQPDHEPRATKYIPQMITLIEKIIANGHAYVGANGDVYFDVRSFADYGCLSHHNIEQLESGARVEVTEVKRDPLDFVLWKLAKPNEPFWDSPWGPGRPGWHIECSAMSMELLGEHFDIHGGGRDLIFPHHENEIAQSQAATHKKFANVWIHGGFLQIEKEKMSKSLGNFVTIREVLREHEPEVLRYLLMASHYRSPLVYTPDTLNQSRQALARFYTALRFLPNAARAANTSFEAAFIEAMDDDFNTPVALSVLFELAHEIQRLREKDKDSAAAHGALLRYLGNVLGVLTSDPEVFFKSGATVDSTKIEALIAARNQARHEKNWAEADRIRKELAAMSIVIEDSASGTTWKYVK
ncbi:cysteine--tRNA ligase [Aquicella lusitana]|uniref:Cysteine--tRNA ligase n=1 Tax=Aquicella lusitana TaxID=254246 RepID=A0A370GFY3_9COXI|nr:cysteine--tRNA ligase [Aquicella lusitana]RDI42702.1 cysteinyl-tRNA synthetase [Aquicella lusitana]VVC73443.1 Cysteine--tRNA ligase [Aquicella lusitana]